MYAANDNQRSTIVSISRRGGQRTWQVEGINPCPSGRLRILGKVRISAGESGANDVATQKRQSPEVFALCPTTLSLLISLSFSIYIYLSFSLFSPPLRISSTICSRFYPRRFHCRSSSTSSSFHINKYFNYKQVIKKLLKNITNNLHNY